MRSPARVAQPGVHALLSPARVAQPGVHALLSTARVALAAVALLATSAACSEDKSFARVTVLSGGDAISDVARLRVHATNGPFEDTLLYPEKPGTVTRIDPRAPVTFSVSFRTCYGGTVEIEVEALDAAENVLGYGKDSQALQLRRVIDSTVFVIPNATRPVVRSDTGPVPDGAPPALACEPSDPAPACGGDRTCIIRCRDDAPAEGMCFQAGNRRPGEACSDNPDCEPGSQCFEFSCSTAAEPRKTCLRFCTDDATCGAAARCNTVVPCGVNATTFKICSRPCDPVGRATSGCATGLRCFIFEGETTSCDCLGAMRVGMVDAPCSTDENCQPGLMCVDRSGRKTCRPICRLAAPVCSVGTCTKLVNPDYQVFGACL